MKTIICSLFVILLWSCNNHINTAYNGRANSEKELAGLKEADSNWALACQSKDIEQMMKFYDADAYFANETPVKGNDNLSGFWKRIFQMPDFSLTWKLDDVRVSTSGDIGYTSGVWQQQFTEKDKLIKSKGRYLAIWHKQSDGSWKVLVDKP